MHVSKTEPVVTDAINLTLRARGREPIAMAMPAEGDTFYLDHESVNGKYCFTLSVSQNGFRVVNKERIG